MANTKRWTEVITPVTQYKNGLMTPEHLEKLSDVAQKSAEIAPPMDADSDLEIVDGFNAMLARFKDGGFKTKNFDSTKTPSIDNKDDVDFAITDTNDKQIAIFANGNIKVKNFDSSFFSDYLKSTNNTQDRTSDILTVLQNKGVCYLGVGDYYVNNLTMPQGTRLVGKGYGTKIYLKSGVTGCAIKVASYCSVSNLAVFGDTSTISLPSTPSTRHGILWSGNYSTTQDSNQQPMRSILSNLWIAHFNGGGITCDNTGVSSIDNFLASDIHIWNCSAGINVAYYSEFHKFVNVRSGQCYIGCINNGGNNIFSNCDFSSNKVGMLMDNTNNQSPNNTHGTCIGCVFNHSDSNNGDGIKMINCSFGFMFVGCQIFFSAINLDSTSGIVFSACNFGGKVSGTTEIRERITINGGGSVLFIGSMFGLAPTKTITDNTKVHFANCYERESGSLVS